LGLIAVEYVNILLSLFWGRGTEEKGIPTASQEGGMLLSSILRNVPGRSEEGRELRCLIKET
jgi:hypothetical protein